MWDLLILEDRHRFVPPQRKTHETFPAPSVKVLIDSLRWIEPEGIAVIPVLIGMKTALKNKLKRWTPMLGKETPMATRKQAVVEKLVLLDPDTGELKDLPEGVLMVNAPTIAPILNTFLAEETATLSSCPSCHERFQGRAKLCAACTAWQALLPQETGIVPHAASLAHAREH